MPIERFFKVSQTSSVEWTDFGDRSLQMSSNPPVKSNFIVVLVALIGLGGLYLLYIGFDNYIHLALRAKLSEAPRNLNLIRTAELELHQSEGRYLPFQTQRSDGGVEYSIEDTTLDTLGLRFEDKLRCQYSVELTQGGMDFTATAQCDFDRDGVVAEYAATAQKDAERLTHKSVY